MTVCWTEPAADASIIRLEVCVLNMILKKIAKPVRPNHVI
jgi:hypothetical protein